MHHRFAVGSSTVALIIVALLASGAGLGASPWREAYAAVPAAPSASERSVAPTPGPPAEREGLRRTPVLRATAPAVSRVQAPGGSTGPDGPRGALDAKSALLELVIVRVPSAGADVRRGHVPRPEQPAPSSRGPPFA
jgi:hypothetical protein